MSVGSAAMSSAPRVTIGLPVYNGGKLLPGAIEALLGQSYTAFELLISDNASTDDTSDICRSYQRLDSRVHYFRQAHNIGMVANHNVLVGSARGEFFKWASHDDLYARDYLERCVAALDEHPEAVLAHAWCVLLDSSDEPIELIRYPETTAARRPSDRLRSMLFDPKGDWVYSLVRTAALRQTPLHATYHGGERTLLAELALHGTFCQVPDWLYFRRDHPNRDLGTRERSILFDPGRTGRLRNPAARLYLEYIWGYFSAVRRAPLSRAERRACYELLGQWLPSRMLEAGFEEPTSLRKQPLLYLLRKATRLVLPPRQASAVELSPAAPDVLRVHDLVAGYEKRARW